MKVVLINGSPNEKGCTYTALKEAADELQRQGVEAEIVHIGKAPVRGCLGCGGCRKTGHCVFDDAVNTLAETLIQADGLVFGSPVFYAGISGQLKCFMDRLFYSRGAQLSGKPAAAVVSARRGGCVSAFDDINRFFTINRMPVVSSQYWNQVHGNTPDEVRKDEEGLQILRTLARNMAWLLKNLEAGRQAGVPEPEREAPLRTNFIR
ncbi:MAG TPA: flavodoxin family protein [Candidatus Limiplasma pullicola]|nr:flavodoxin family protein [Candidatus Limiplasma pullicola]